MDTNIVGLNCPYCGTPLHLEKQGIVTDVYRCENNHKQTVEKSRIRMDKSRIRTLSEKHPKIGEIKWQSH